MISVAIANFNGGPFLQHAVTSALAQRGIAVEVLIVDDRSTDASWSLAQQLAAADDRVRCWQLPENRGPAGARNVALANARGRWFAVLDNDDLIHPDRLRRLIDEAERTNATMIADDLLVFDDLRAQPPSTFLRGNRALEPQWIGLADYLREAVMFGRAPNLGFLKPIFRRDFLLDHQLVYDERLRIAEDDDFVIRSLLAGARYRLLPRPMYFYRKHGTSISHRLSGSHADRMMAASARLGTEVQSAGGEVTRAYRRRHRALRTAWGYAHLREALMQGRAGAALRVVLSTPSSVLLLRQLAAAIARRFLQRLPHPAAPVGQADSNAVLFISRQRLAGSTNGSSAYLIALAEAVRAAGLVPHLLQPSPVLFGRTPFFRLRPEMRVFETVRIRSSLAIGDWRIVRDPAVFGAALRAIVGRLARRIGIGGALGRDKKAPYAIAAEWSSSDLRYVAEFGRGVAPVAIVDYVFQAEALPYLLDPELRSGVVMHDLFSARSDQFGTNDRDSVATMTLEAELDLLRCTDAVIAIQAAEATFVADHLPTSRVILAPMAATPVAATQPGNGQRLLFVGSNTAPNVYGLRWFIEEVWPLVRRGAPDATLAVAGTVSAGFTAGTAGVEMLGLVDDLTPLYAQAGIVISPLLQGSGLKIKLIEAMANGKAIIATATTLQGVDHLAGTAVVRADTAADFATAILRLHGDSAERERLAANALAAATREFGPEAAFADFRRWLSATPDQGVARNFQARI